MGALSRGRVRELVVVSAGLGLEGGGAAHLGRLCLVGAAEFCAAAGIRLHVMYLGTPNDLFPSLHIRHFFGDKRRLAAAILATQLVPRAPTLVFDHPGPARVQALVPGPLRSRYLLFLLGIDARGPFAWDRRRTLQAASVRIAISEHTRARVLRALPSLPGVDVIHPALEDRPPSGAEDRALLDELGRGFLLIVGRMSASERYKGHDLLLDALPLIRALRPAVRLVVVGQGDDRPRLEARARGEGLQPLVRFTSFVSEATLRELYRRAAVFVMPSRDEGFGLVYLEAMRAGRPCVALRDSAAEEIVVDRETGRLVADDANALATVLADLLSDTDRAARLGANGERRWRDHFGQDVFARAFHAQLSRLTGFGDVRD